MNYIKCLLLELINNIFTDFIICGLIHFLYEIEENPCSVLEIELLTKSEKRHNSTSTYWTMTSEALINKNSHHFQTG